jgi:membrane protease YdiL (CAAX protease family)
MSVVSVVIFAPIIEEFLFRGCLQNYLKLHFGTKAAIQLSALCFALFHLTPSQGIGNFSLAVSLFLLGLFLGFLYEKQNSLFASVGLHMTFNTVSALRIIMEAAA